MTKTDLRNFTLGAIKQTELEWDRERDQNQPNTKVWVQVQLKLQCEKLNVILWKPILSRSRSR